MIINSGFEKRIHSLKFCCHPRLFEDENVRPSGGIGEQARHKNWRINLLRLFSLSEMPEMLETRSYTASKRHLSPEHGIHRFARLTLCPQILQVF